MSMEDQYALIDAYLLGQLDDVQKAEFETALKDQHFSEEFAFRKEVLEASKLQGRKDLKSRLKKLDQPESTNLMKRYPQWVSIAATLLLLIAAFFVVRVNLNTLDKVYVSHYEKLPNKVAVIVRGEEDMDELKQSMVVYNMGNYDQALEQFEKLDEEHPELNMYKGVIALEREQVEEAMGYFKPFAEDTDSEYYEEGKWYLALCYLKNGNLDKVKSTLAPLEENDDYYGQKAQSLLNEIKDL